MSNKNLIAGFIAIAMAIWLFSSELTSNVVNADDNIEMSPVTAVPLVRVTASEAEMRNLFLTVSGQTRANRTVHVKAEVFGRVNHIAAEKGSHVEAGDLLCKIAIDTRQGQFDQTKAELDSAQLEYNGILDLKRRGLQSDINVAKTKAALEGARARAQSAEIALAKTNILAPFAGVVESQPVEVGDFLNIGQDCVTLIELDPVLVVGQVAEKNINAIRFGGQVDVTLMTGDRLQGTVSYIGRAPDAATRTYPIEVTVDEPGENIRTGLTAQLNLPLGEQTAHLISSASLVLNDEGVIGVRTVDSRNVVHFSPVQILSEESGGVWVGGLAEQVNLITIGHEEVYAGQVVKTDFTPLNTLVGR